MVLAMEWGRKEQGTLRVGYCTCRMMTGSVPESVSRSWALLRRMQDLSPGDAPREDVSSVLSLWLQRAKGFVMWALPPEPGTQMRLHTYLVL